MWQLRTSVHVECDDPDCLGNYCRDFAMGEAEGMRGWQAKMRENGWRFYHGQRVQCPDCSARNRRMVPR